MKEKEKDYNITIQTIIDKPQNLNLSTYYEGDENILGPWVWDGILEMLKKRSDIFYSPNPFNPKLAKTLKEKKIKVKEIKSIPSDSGTNPIYCVILDAFMEGNSIFNFDIDRIIGEVNLVKVPHTDSIVDWHWYLDSNPSKLTIVQQLSDPDSYKGGDYQIWMGQNNVVTLPRKKNSVAIFPSFCLQKITPITEGTKEYMIAHSGNNKLM